MIITITDLKNGLTPEQRDALRQNLNIEAAAKAVYEAGIVAFDAPHAEIAAGMQEYCQIVARIRSKAAQKVQVIHE